MPLVLQQHFSSSDREYADVEGVLYHYPRQYFARIKPFEPFIYYRPLGRSAPRPDSRRYFGHGVLGEPWPDPSDEHLRFVPIVQYEEFRSLVPLRDPRGNYYETGGPDGPQAQSAVRTISEIAYHRILAAGEVAVTGISALPSSLVVERAGYAAASSGWPKDVLRLADRVPPGAGYVPRAGDPPNVYEAAALQERARADHQRVLGEIVAKVRRLGGTCWYNNNIDLLARLGDQRLLIEAKSLTDVHDAVHRMRYGLGQLMDYRVRYRAGLRTAKHRGSRTFSTENRVAFVSSVDGKIVPMNAEAHRKRLFTT